MDPPAGGDVAGQLEALRQALGFGAEGGAPGEQAGDAAAVEAPGQAHQQRPAPRAREAAVDEQQNAAGR